LSLHEQNETESILIVENLWPLLLVCKSLLSPCLRQGNNFNGKLKKVGLKKSGYAFGAILIHEPSA